MEKSTALTMLVVGNVPEASRLVEFERLFTFRATFVTTLAECDEALADDTFNCVVSAVRLEDGTSATEILDVVKHRCPFRPVIMVADPADADCLLEALAHGLDDKQIRCEDLALSAELLECTVRRCLATFIPAPSDDSPAFQYAVGQAIYEGLEETVILFDEHTHLLYFNRAAQDLAQRVFGFALEIGSTLDELYTDNVPLGFRERVDEYIRRSCHGETVVMREETTFANGDTMVRQYRYAPLFNRNGRPFASVCTSRDLAEVRVAEDKLEQSEARFWQFFEQLPIGIGVVDQAGTWVRVNPALQKFFGDDEDALKEMSPIDVTHEDDVAETLAKIRVLRSGHVPFVKFEKRYRHRDGHVLWADVMSMPLHLDAKPGYFLSIISDITQRKQLEDQLNQTEQMRLIGQLAGGVAHDFNNLLTIISSYTHYVLDDMGEDSPYASALEKVLNASQRGSSLTDQLLAFSRRHQASIEPVELGTIIADLCEIIERVVAPQITLETHFDDRPLIVTIDHGQLEQVFLNLVMNARDAMSDGGILVLETRRTDLDEPCEGRFERIPAGSYGVLEVRDNGSGIPEEIMARIFEPFFTTKAVNQGTGLGLASARGLVAQAGGFIDVDSSPGEGTSFRVLLPLSEGTSPAEREDTARNPDPSVDLDATVLLVEDDIDVREALRSYLDRQGFHVLDATNGTDALECVRQHAECIDILLTDVIMPGMNGRQLAAAVGEACPDAHIFLMTGYAGNNIGEMSSDWTLLSKPLDLNELGRRLHEALE